MMLGLLMSISIVWLVSTHYKSIQKMFSKENISATVYLPDVQNSNLDDEKHIGNNSQINTMKLSIHLEIEGLSIIVNTSLKQCQF